MNLGKVVNSIILTLFLSILGYTQINSFRGLTLLVSTRADVEKKLGKAKSKDFYQYEINEGRISFAYQSKVCEDGWNVPKDTLIYIRFEPKELLGKSFEELKLDRNKFTRSIDDAFWGKWTNPNEGISYYFQNVDRSLENIFYFPRKSDNNLRCNGFPPYAPEGFYYTREKYRFYSKESSLEDNINDFTVKFFNLYNELASYASDKKYNMKGYVLVYFDKQMSFQKYQNYLRKLKTYLEKRFKVDSSKVVFIEGGLRESSSVEFYMLESKLPPPSPEPTLPSPQFMKKK